jgi:uncharacterized repeat protein (TIGR03806 family)
MRILCTLAALGGLLALVGQVCNLSASSQTTASESKPVRKTHGLEKRVPWTSSKLKGFPEPPPPYKTQRAFPKVQFSEPLDLTYAPGANRLLVATRPGKIFSFVNDPKAEKTDLLLDLPGKVIYGFTVHPQFAKNGYIYVTYLPHPEKDNDPKGTRVARFKAQGTPPRVDVASEKIIFEWRNGGHNGGCLKFGPDGYLYIVTGDGSGIADELNIGQDLGSIFGKLLRIDVDNPSPGKAYSIPKDNPFLNTKGALPEIYAYGLRQLWRFSFDRKTGDCWGGEVGQDLWEMVYNIQKGGNYGWSVQEGNYPFRPERKKGPTPILKPVVEHSHADFRSITGGFVYRGSRLKELQRHYIYGDFDTGRVWAFVSPEGIQAPKELVDLEHRELARTTFRIVSWGEDEDGELYLVDFTGGGLHQLVKSDQKDESASFPRKLSETGIFASTRDYQVAPGIIPYSVNGQLWGDHTLKDRFLAVPNDYKIGFDEITYPQPSPGAPPGWRFPDGTVLVKTFSMEMERGNPKSRKRLETRLLHFQQFPGTQEYGDQYWRGYTYLWNEDQTDAELLDEKGLDKLLKIKVDGQVVEQNYRFPSRAECSLCHTNAAKFALGVNTMQMNRDHVYPSPEGGVMANQLATLEHIGLFSKPLPKAPQLLPYLVDHMDEKADLHERARSYLHSNCSHCHIKWGGGNADFKLVSTLALKEMGILDVPPAHGSFDIKNARLLAAGEPERSLIYVRMAKTGLGRMPHIGSRVPDPLAVRLMHDWIKQMPRN